MNNYFEYYSCGCRFDHVSCQIIYCSVHKAAPDLLNAAKEVLSWVQSDAYGYGELREAVSKAELKEA